MAPFISEPGAEKKPMERKERNEQFVHNEKCAVTLEKANMKLKPQKSGERKKTQIKCVHSFVAVSATSKRLARFKRNKKSSEEKTLHFID